MKKTILLLIAILLCSCGSRKVQKSETKDKTHIAISDTTTTKIVDNSVIKTVEIDSTSEMVIEPIDSTREMTVNGKKYTNARIYWKKTNKVKELVENKNVVTTQRKAVKINYDNDKVFKEKTTDKTVSYWWLLWFLLLIPIWYFFKKGNLFF